MSTMGGPPSSIGNIVTTIRSYLRRRAGSAVGSGAVAILGAVLGAAWLFAGPSGWTPGTAVPLILVATGGLSLLVLVVWVSAKVRAWTSEPSLAAEMERSARLPEGSVRAQVELARSVPPGVSAELARAGETALLKRLTGSAGRLAGASGREAGRILRLSTTGGLVLGVLAAGLLVLSPSRARSAWAGLTRPVTLLSPEPLPPLELSPGDAELPRGEAPLVDVRAEGRDSVTVHWQEIGDVPQEERLGVVSGRAETSLPELDVEMRYWASSADGDRTDTYTLSPSDPSVFADLAFQITYPPHTRLPVETLRLPPVALRVPEGTVFTVSGQVQGRGTAVLIVDEGGEVAARLPVEAGRFSGRWRPVRSETVQWQLEEGQEGGQLPDPLDLEVVPDASPILVLPVPGADSDMPLSRRFPILVDASDDYGVSWVEIETTLSRAGVGETPVRDRIPTSDLPRVTLRPVLDFSTWGLRPGDEILLRAKASDNAPAGHVVETPFYRLLVPDASQVRETALARIDETARRGEDLLDRVRRETAALRDLERRSRFGSGGDSRGGNDSDAFQEREELLQALERQSELADSLDELREGLAEAREALADMARESAADAELQARIEELERALEEVLGPEARERLEELRESLGDGPLPENSPEVLEELAARQERLEAELERALEELRRSAMEEAVRGAEQEVQALLETQESLVDELLRGEGEARQREQAQRTGAVEEQLSALSEELERGGDQNVGSRTQSAGSEVSEARQAMEAAADASQDGDREEAAQQAAEAAESLAQALEQLQEARAQMEEESAEEWREGLEQGVQDVLSLSRRQAELRESLRDILPGFIGEFEDDQVALLEGLRNLRRDLREATESEPELGQLLSDEVDASIAAVDQAVRGLRGGSGSLPDPEAFADSAQLAMNRVALLALQALEQGEAPPAGAEGEQMTEDMASVGAQQQALNEEAARLSPESSPGGNPSPQELQDLVTGQQGVAAVLQEMARRPGPGGMRSTLEALANEGDALAEELRQGRLDATTLERQEQFLQRLLSAGRTLEQDGPTDEREATSAEELPRRAVTAIPEDLLDPLAFPLPTAEELRALTPGQRGLVLDYFDRVNRRRAAEGAR